MRNILFSLLSLAVAWPALAGREPAPQPKLTIEVLPPVRQVPLDLYSPGRLYIAGASAVRTIDLGNAYAQSAVAIANVQETGGLAVSGDHARVYVTSSKTMGSAVSAIDTDKQAMVDQVVFAAGDNVSPGAVTVMPYDQRVQVTDTNANVLFTHDAANLASFTVETMPYVAMPAFLAYRPGTLDLYVSDFFTGSEQFALRRPFVDWVKGEILFLYAPLDVPPTITNADGDSGAQMAFLTGQKLLVAANSRGDELVVFDEDTRTPLDRVSVPEMPFTVTVDPSSSASSGRVFVVSLQGAAVSVYDIARTANGASITLEASMNPCHTTPRRVVFGQLASTAYVLCHDGVTVLDAATLLPKKVIEVNGALCTDMVWASK